MVHLLIHQTPNPSSSSSETPYISSSSSGESSSSASQEKTYVKIISVEDPENSGNYIYLPVGFYKKSGEEITELPESEIPEVEGVYPLSGTEKRDELYEYEVQTIDEEPRMLINANSAIPDNLEPGWGENSDSSYSYEEGIYIARISSEDVHEYDAKYAYACDGVYKLVYRDKYYEIQYFDRWNPTDPVCGDVEKLGTYKCYLFRKDGYSRNIVKIEERLGAWDLPIFNGL